MISTMNSCVGLRYYVAPRGVDNFEVGQYEEDEYG